MITTCQQCGAELLSGTSFCRKCGAPIPELANDPTTKLLDPSDGVSTQRLDPRPTSPGRVPLNAPPATPVAATPWLANKGLLVGLIALLLVAGIASTVAIVRSRGDRAARLIDSLTYPGARKLVDIASEGGGHAVHLETADSFDNVQDWYRRKLEPTKVMQLTSFSVVMKNERTTATIVREGDKTNILLKIVP